MDLLTTLENSVHIALASFSEDVQTKWVFGKEREAVSIFAFDHLLNQLSSNKIIQQNSQLAIESRVPQLKKDDNIKRKMEVCKDLVIWPNPFENCWVSKNESGNYPLCVLEWKANRDSFEDNDINWLKEYTTETPTKIGFIINVDFYMRSFIVKAEKIVNGHVTQNWLKLS